MIIFIISSSIESKRVKFLILKKIVKKCVYTHRLTFCSCSIVCVRYMVSFFSRGCSRAISRECFGSRATSNTSDLGEDRTLNAYSVSAQWRVGWSGMENPTLWITATAPRQQHPKQRSCVQGRGPNENRELFDIDSNRNVLVINLQIPTGCRHIVINQIINISL